MKGRHLVRRVLCVLLAAILCTTAAFGTFYGIKGYRMYQDAISHKSIEERVDEIRGREHFTKYSELPEFYINAVISVEDHRFRKHFGIDPIALCRAVWTDLRAMSFVEGGSTITQQLAKNLLFTREKTIERKAAEVFAVFDIERKYSKDEIFEIYVNMAGFGGNYDGIYEAAKGYFEKEPLELTDYEAAMLAGVPNAPSIYSPEVSREKAEKRVGLVLDSMVRYKCITRGQADMIKSKSSR